MLASSEQKGSVASACTTDLLKKLENEGYAIAPTCIAEEIIEVLGSHLTQDLYAQRNLLALPIVRELATSGTVRTLAEESAIPSNRGSSARRHAGSV